jgi:NAD(P)-dependent dehydrogenase (short-subunit alcohol dehydrogenase family)
VIGTDVQVRTSTVDCHKLIQVDLSKLVIDSSAKDEFRSTIIQYLEGSNSQLRALVNNAAVQRLGGVDQLSIEEFEESLRVNVSVPFLLSKLFSGELAESEGSIVNIGSIHSQLTKPGFVGYATSKGAISTLTKALAVDFNGKVRVNCIEPAALDTPMLAAGFLNKSKAFDALKNCHPSGFIGDPAEVADLCVYMSEPRTSFLNGATVPIDGGVRSRLHDPD